MAFAGKGEIAGETYQMDLKTSCNSVRGTREFVCSVRTTKGEFKMETLYFFGPLALVVSVIYFAIRQINAASYLRRPTESPAYASPSETHPENCPRESLEQRYVDWFTSEKASRTREKAESADDEKFQIGTAFMVDGQSYRPDYEIRNSVH